MQRPPHPFDYVNYRETGELSDLTVAIGEEPELHLHKFPLYTKSAHFRRRATESRVQLPAEFPGGAACFAQVADFCYGKRLDIAPENCVQLNCAARLLGMSGRDNLIEMTDRYLEDILRSAQVTRAVGPVVELLVRAAAIGECALGDEDGAAESRIKEGAEAETNISSSGGKTGKSEPSVAIAERCFAALLDAWSRPGLGGGIGVVGERLLRLPLDWFCRLVRAAAGGEGDRQRRALAELAARYLHRVFLREAQLEKKAEAEAAAAARAEHPGEAVSTPSAAAENEDGKAGSDTEADEASRSRKRPEEESEERSRQLEPQEPAGQVLDRVVLALPEATPLAEVISADWIQRALKISEKYGCECRGRLLQLAGNTLHRFRQEELHKMPSPVLCDIVSSSVRNKGVQPEVLSCVIDNHLLDLARGGSLGTDDFVKLAASVPPEYRASHDALYEVAETLLSGGDSLPDEKQKEVIETVDLSRCDVATLQRALDKGVIPSKLVCQSAIDLAKRLRQQLHQLHPQSQHHYAYPDSARELGYRLREETRPTGSVSGRYPISARPRYDTALSSHGGDYGRPRQYGGSGGIGSSVHYTDPYASVSSYAGHSYDEPEDSYSYYDPPGTRYTSHDYDVDLLLLEAERSRTQQQHHLGSRRSQKY